MLRSRWRGVGERRISIEALEAGHWTWSDEHNQVGLRSSETCWVRPGTPAICSQRKEIAETFMMDRRDRHRFVSIASQTYHAALAAIVLALLTLAMRRSRFADVAHTPWLVVLVLACVTAALTPDVGGARDIHIGIGFTVLALGCVLGIAGHLLMRPRESADPA